MPRFLIMETDGTIGVKSTVKGSMIKPKSFEIGRVRFTRVPKLLVVNQSPHVPFRMDEERSAFSFLFLHQVWPGGLESAIFPPESTAVDHLRLLLKTGKLSPELHALIERKINIQKSLDTQGTPKTGYEDPVRVDANDAVTDNADDGDDGDDGGDDRCPDADKDSRLQVEQLTTINGFKVLSKHENQAARYFMDALINQNTEHRRSSNQLSDAEVSALEPSLNPGISKYGNHGLLEIELAKAVETMTTCKMQLASYDWASLHITGAIPEQLLFVISGEGGSGKSHIIRSIVLAAKIQYGKTPGMYGSVLVVAPTGCAAYNAGGVTWQSALSVQEGGTQSITEALSIRLQARLAGLEVLVFDEYSMLSAHDLYDIDRRLKSAQTNPAKKSKPFGGESMCNSHRR